MQQNLDIIILWQNCKTVRVFAFSRHGNHPSTIWQPIQLLLPEKNSNKTHVRSKSNSCTILKHDNVLAHNVIDMVTCIQSAMQKIVTNQALS